MTVSARATGVPRNAPCPCGSGRRFRDCHGAIGPARPEASGGADAWLHAAMAAQLSGRFDEAADLYARVLAIEPGDFDALHMMGVVRMQQDRHREGLDWIERALAVRPGVVAALRNAALARGGGAARDAGAAYDAWIARRERGIVADRAPALARIAARPGAIRFSILLPTFETPTAWLRECLDSVLAQTYPHWELCVVDDASPAADVGGVLREYASRDPRIRVAMRERNGHICAATNDALAMATSPYIALLDHDDKLAPRALAEMALEISTRPDAAIVYSDEDKFDERGHRFDPYFKPGWNPALATSQNFVSHLGVYRTGLVREVGGFRPGTEGAQDWDLLLRCAERAGDRAIRHVPQVLYHWRASAVSTATSMQAKDYAARAQDRVVAGHFARRGVPADIKRVVDGNFVQADPRPVERSSIALIVLAVDGAGTSGPGGWGDPRAVGADEVAVAPLASRVAAFASPTLVLAPGDAEAIGDAVRATRSQILVFVRADVRPTGAGVVGLLAAHAAQPDTGPVGGVLYDPFGVAGAGPLVLDGAVIAARAFPIEEIAVDVMGSRDQVVQNLSAVRGDAMAVKRVLWDRLGGFDTGGLARRYHDVDFCLRAADLGARTVWHPAAGFVAAGVVTIGNAGSAADPGDGDVRAMQHRWGSRLGSDPAYHPELDAPPRVFRLRRDPYEPTAQPADRPEPAR